MTDPSQPPGFTPPPPSPGGKAPPAEWPARFSSWAVLVGAVIVVAVLAGLGILVWHAFVRAGLFTAGERALRDVVAFALLLLGATLMGAGVVFLLVEAKKAPPAPPAPAAPNVQGLGPAGGGTPFDPGAATAGLLDATEGRRPSFVLLVLGVVLVLLALASSGLVTVSMGEGGTTTTTTTTTTLAPEDPGPDGDAGG